MPGTKEKTVWFSRGLDTVDEVMRIIKENDADRKIRIVATQTELNPGADSQSDVFFIEPSGLQPDRYMEWVDGVVADHRVDLIVPGHSTRLFAANQARLKEKGVHVLVAGSEATLNLLKSKQTTYEALTGVDVPVPDFKVVTTLAEFDAACSYLAGLGHKGICFKPTVGVFGRGFHSLAETSLAQLYRRLASTDISMAEARRCLGQQPVFDPLMVMPFLPGPERSVDCLARDGELIRYIIRQKVHRQDYQIVEANEKIGQYCAQVTRSFGLSGMFNVQFRDLWGVHYLLEINSRMAGGLYKASACGLGLPYWAVRLFTGTVEPKDIPYPRTSIKIVRQSHYVVEVL